MDGVCEDVVTLSKGCVISTDETTTIDEQMHVQEEIIMDSGGIELSQGAMSNEEARLLDLSAIKLPPKIRKHGRPKGLDKTVVACQGKSE